MLLALSDTIVNDEYKRRKKTNGNNLYIVYQILHYCKCANT